MLENPLSKVSREEQAVRPLSAKRGQQTQLGYAYILRFIDRDKLEWWVFAFS